MANISKRNLRREKEIQEASKTRREIIQARLSRREMIKMGLLTSAGMLVPVKGLSARAADPNAMIPLDNPVSPPTTPFSEPLPIMPIKAPAASLSPVWTVNPNWEMGEGRPLPHQCINDYPPQKVYEVHQKEMQVSMSRDLPLQTVWGYDGMVPGPTFVARLGEPILIRHYNDLPADNKGFGINSVSTHLHNGHTPSESDGHPCNYFEAGQYYDVHYPNVLAGCDSTHPPVGDINEAMGTMWFHDHRLDHTAQNVYKGLFTFYLMFNHLDTGDETTGFRLPSFPQFDIPMFFHDRVFDAQTGQSFYDLFNLDGIIGDKFMVNGMVQPFFEVHPRRYRLRLHNPGPSRFCEFFLTDPNNPNARNFFWQISQDGNLLPKPIRVQSVRLSPAERADIIVDFAAFAGRSIYMENRLQQVNGRGPTNKILPANAGGKYMRFDVVLPAVPDNSANPANITKFYDLPNRTAVPRITRTFRFDRKNGQWAVNGRFVNCDETRFRIRQNTVEKWIIKNNSGGWQHPIHIHFEEFQMLKRNGVAIKAGTADYGRRDVVRLGFNETVEILFRFRDFKGVYPMHCHNVVHEDHAMMLLWEINDVGDNITNP